MNPILLLLLLAASEQHFHGRRGTSRLSLPSSLSSLSSVLSTPYFDTFKMELLLDKLHGAVDTLERVNKLSQVVREPRSLNLPVRTAALPSPAQSSAPAPAPAVSSESPLASLAPLAAQLSQMGDIKALMQNLGPMLSLLGNSQEK